MATKSVTDKKPRNQQQKSTLEVLDDLRSSSIKNTASELKKIGGGVMNELLGGREYPERYPREQEQPKPQKKEVKLFNYAEYRENEMVTAQIKELMKQIRQEIETIKKQESTLLNEVKDVEKLTVEAMPEKVGIYHVRFLELVLSILRTLREKISDSGTWLAAMMSKKKKRGSLFAVRSKKMGTQYSLSQELQSARSVQ